MNFLAPPNVLIFVGLLLNVLQLLLITVFKTAAH